MNTFFFPSSSQARPDVSIGKILTTIFRNRFPRRAEIDDARCCFNRPRVASEVKVDGAHKNV